MTPRVSARFSAEAFTPNAATAQLQAKVRRLEAQKQRILESAALEDDAAAQAAAEAQVEALLKEQKKPKEKPAPPILSPDERKEAVALFKGDAGFVIAEKFEIKLTRDKLRCLTDGQWLNDEVINFYMKMLQERCKEGNGYQQSYFCNSFFYTKLTEGGTYTYKNVARWTKRAKVDVFALDLVFVPIHVHGIHWCMGVVDVPRKEVRYYDSMSGGDHGFGEHMLQWVADEHKDKKGKPLPDAGTWSVVRPQNVPQQENGNDCGVFMVTCAEYLSRGTDPTFHQKNISDIRKLIALRCHRMRI